MFRSVVLGAALTALALAPAARAQESDEAWKKLVLRALDAASSNDYATAEQTFQQALREAERFGPDDARVGSTFNNLGLVYRAEKKYADAESAYRRALPILEKVYGDGIDAANVSFNIANVMFDQGHQSAALPYIQKGLPAYETLLGPDNLKTAAMLCMMGDIYRLEKNYQGAEGPLRRCADIRESQGGIQNPELAEAIHSLALTYVGEGKYVLADSRFTLAEKIRENTLGITSPLLAQTLEDHIALLKQMGRDKEAEKLNAIASAIRRNQKGGK
jgi:tetratricopeptide (TPR) repeat protein